MDPNRDRGSQMFNKNPVIANTSKNKMGNSYINSVRNIDNLSYNQNLMKRNYEQNNQKNFTNTDEVIQSDPIDENDYNN